jgi:hypothetical protein
MTRPILALGATLVGLGLCLAAPVPAERQLPTLYYPTTPGTELRYKVGDFDDGDRLWGWLPELVTDPDDAPFACNVEECTVRVTDVKTAQGVKHVTTEVWSSRPNAAVWTFVTAVSPDGVAGLSSCIHPNRLAPYEPPFCELKIPCRAGDEWVVKSRDRTDGCKIHQKRRVKAVERVAVPAGVFHAIRVEITGCDDDHRSIRWYAPGVGEVKWVRHSPRPKVLMVLAACDPGRR